MCGGHHVAAGGGKLHELGARILGLETDDVRGNTVNLLVRFRSWRSARRSCQHTVVGKPSFRLVKKRCAWYLRVKLKPHHELPFAEGEEFLEGMSLDQGAGVWPVF